MSAFSFASLDLFKMANFDCVAETSYFSSFVFLFAAYVVSPTCVGVT